MKTIGKRSLSSQGSSLVQTIPAILEMFVAGGMDNKTFLYSELIFLYYIVFSASLHFTRV